MSNKPIFVVTHPRACSTAFERVKALRLMLQPEAEYWQVFMTCRDTLKCIHEPFGDAFYYGPERLSSRFEADEKARVTTGFSESTYKTIIDRFEKEGGEVRITPSLRSCHKQDPSSLHSLASRCGHFMQNSSITILIAIAKRFTPPHRFLRTWLLTRASGIAESLICQDNFCTRTRIAKPPCSNGSVLVFI